MLQQKRTYQQLERGLSHSYPFRFDGLDVLPDQWVGKGVKRRSFQQCSFLAFGRLFYNRLCNTTDYVPLPDLRSPISTTLGDNDSTSQMTLSTDVCLVSLREGVAASPGPEHTAKYMAGAATDDTPTLGSRAQMRAYLMNRLRATVTEHSDQAAIESWISAYAPRHLAAYEAAADIDAKNKLVEMLQSDVALSILNQLHKNE